ncbi:hypothetical protein ABER61_19010 [Brevibacillus formosus]|nr:hypothetical protein [Brevibacillus formosus]MED1958975.1 hypothetical protein [Brevibacillus formosus]
MGAVKKIEVILAAPTKHGVNANIWSGKNNGDLTGGIFNCSD